MKEYPPSLERLIKELKRLPGIGPKSATRLALSLLRNPSHIESLANSLMEVKNRVRLCSVCYNFADEELCTICQDKKRNRNKICIVETQGELLAIESSGEYDGLYHVLEGSISPLDGVRPEDLRIKELINRIETEDINEIILATNPTVEGEATASYIADLLKEKDIRITRIAYGIPIGGDLKYADKMTVKTSLDNRREF